MIGRTMSALVGSSAIAIALAFCGCSDKEQETPRIVARLRSSGGAFEPMVAKDATFALGVNLNKDLAFKLVDSYAERMFRLLKTDPGEIAEAKAKIEAYKQDPFMDAPQDFRDFLEKSGLRNVSLRWAVLSSEGPIAVKSRSPQLGELSLAIAGNIDIEKVMAAILELQKEKGGDDISFEQVSIDGEKAWRAVPRNKSAERAMEKANADPYVASLGGQLTLVAMSREMLERQIRLYRGGEGKGDALGGFSPSDGDFAHLSMYGIGDLARQCIPRRELRNVTKVMPKGDQVISGLKALSIDIKTAPDGSTKQSLTLEAASDDDAEQLRTLAKTGLIMANAMASNNPAVPKDVAKMIGALRIDGTGNKVGLLNSDILSILGGAIFPSISSAIRKAKTQNRKGTQWKDSAR